jgi:hypothetical protein
MKNSENFDAKVLLEVPYIYLKHETNKNRNFKKI